MTMSLPVLSGQLLVGLINGSFYAILSLGLSIIFGLLGIVNLTQGAFYMVGAFFAWMLLQWLGVGYWGALILAPLLAVPQLTHYFLDAFLWRRSANPRLGRLL